MGLITVWGYTKSVEIYRGDNHEVWFPTKVVEKRA